MEKIEWKEFKELWGTPAGKVVTVAVPLLQYLVVEGTGSPEVAGGKFQQAIQALYTAAYTMKFAAKNAGIADWKVTPLEALWWDPSGRDLSSEDFGAAPGTMAWKTLLMQPALVTQGMLDAAREEAVRKKKDVPALRLVRLETWEEGLCLQALHVGPYAGERTTFGTMHGWIQANGYQVRGRHHEIYLSDPGRTAPERLKTLLRLPIEKVTA
jgi:hypothetical protein